MLALERQLCVALCELIELALLTALGGSQLHARPAPRFQQPGDCVKVHFGLELAPHDHLRRNGAARGVVLRDELLGYLVVADLADVVEVKALAVGEDPVADLEDLGVCLAARRRDGDKIDHAKRRSVEPVAIDRVLDRRDAVPVDGGLFVLATLGCIFHALIELGLNLAEVAGEEAFDPLDVRAVVLL